MSSPLVSSRMKSLFDSFFLRLRLENWDFFHLFLRLVLFICIKHTSSLVCHIRLGLRTRAQLRMKDKIGILIRAERPLVIFIDVVVGLIHYWWWRVFSSDRRPRQRWPRQQSECMRAHLLIHIYRPKLRKKIIQPTIWMTDRPTELSSFLVVIEIPPPTNCYTYIKVHTYRVQTWWQTWAITTLYYDHISSPLDTY